MDMGSELEIGVSSSLHSITRVYPWQRYESIFFLKLWVKYLSILGTSALLGNPSITTVTMKSKTVRSSDETHIICSE